MRTKHLLGATTLMLAATTAAVPALANGRGGGSPENATPCTLNYIDIDLASRNMSFGVYCPDGGYISVHATVYYQDINSTRTLPDSGSRYVEPGETWTVWTQDNSRENYWGKADVGVLHISQTMCSGPGCPLTLAHLVENDLD